MRIGEIAGSPALCACCEKEAIMASGTGQEWLVPFSRQERFFHIISLIRAYDLLTVSLICLIIATLIHSLRQDL